MNGRVADEALNRSVNNLIQGNQRDMEKSWDRSDREYVKRIGGVTTDQANAAAASISSRSIALL